MISVDILEFQDIIGNCMDIHNETTMATYEIRGGEKAEVFIRINDPIKLQRLSSGRYTNDVLRAIQERHRHNHRLLDAFFQTQMTTEDRWKLIEQYFLGNEDYVSNVLNLHD